MVNGHRGEIEATLGALAELEHTFGEEDMLAVAERF